MLAVVQVVSIAIAAAALLIGLWILFPGLRDGAERRNLDRLRGKERQTVLRALAARHGLQLSHLPPEAQVEEVQRVVASKMAGLFVKWAVTELIFIVAAVIAIITFVAPEWLGFAPAAAT